MAADQSALFEDSWNRAEEYPLNVLRFGSNIGSLRAHKTLLETNAPDLFYSESRVVVLEFEKDGTRPALKKEITSTVGLCNWLGISSPNASSGSSTTIPHITPANSTCQPSNSDANVPANVVSTALLGPSTSGGTPATVNPNSQFTSPVSNIRCRFIFFQAPTSEAKLSVSRGMASQILTYFQVMPIYIDFISVFAVEFGKQVEAVELRFAGFRARSLLSNPARGLHLSNRALCGRNYQLCYNLKCVARKYGGMKREDWNWSPRQASINHQFDVGEGNSVWIIAAARDHLQKRVQELTGANGMVEDRSFNSSVDSFISSFAVHLLLAQWATEDWRGYIRWLEQVLEEKTIYALQSGDFVPSAEDISFVQKKEDETNKAIMMLDANADILESLAKFYQSLMTNDDFELRNNGRCKRSVADFVQQLQDYGHDFKMHAARAKTLGKITADRKNLVQQHLQSHTTEQMKLLTERAQREAIIMKVIGIVTFILLPATFVSTFFSTDVVKYQNGAGEDGGSDESYSQLALQRWFEVTVPLTLATFVFAGCWLYWKAAKTWTKWFFGKFIMACICSWTRRGRTCLEDEEKGA